jgi:hypothetical protein
LKLEHIRLCKELERVDQALSILGSLDGTVASKPGRKAKVAVAAVAAPKRKISAAARKKMSEAARRKRLPQSSKRKFIQTHQHTPLAPL